MKIDRWHLWVVLPLFYGAFWLWYTNLEGPIGDQEKRDFLEILANRGDLDNDTLLQFRKFMEEDFGRDFIMVNVLDMAEQPKEMPATGPNASTDEVMGHYMEFMFSELWVRASHPVFWGEAISPAVDVVGIEGAREWDRAVLMRYRSRRDLLEIITHPNLRDRHEYKQAALVKTIAYPVEASLYLTDVRFTLAFVGLIVMLLADMLLFRRRDPPMTF